MNHKKIALLASILMVTLVVGVYAVVLSNTVTTTWTLKEAPGTNLELYWADPYWQPSGDLNRGQEIYASIGLRNTGDASYNVKAKFRIYTGGAALSPGDIVRMEYNEHKGEGWKDMIGVLVQGAVAHEVTGYFGDPAGFPVGSPYDVVASYRIVFDGSAPLVQYWFEAWIEEA